jgi:hypothetical protein
VRSALTKGLLVTVDVARACGRLTQPSQASEMDPGNWTGS